MRLWSVDAPRLVLLRVLAVTTGCLALPVLRCIWGKRAYAR